MDNKDVILKNTESVEKKNVKVKKKKTTGIYAVGDVWNIFPAPFIMTELDVRVRFYTVATENKPSRLVANGVKNRLDNKYQIMLMAGERKRLMDEYHVTSNELYRYLNLELRRAVALMESHPEKYMQKTEVSVN